MAQFGRTGTPTPTRTTSSNDELSYLNPKEMVIGGTIVSGTQFLDKDVLITISKLTKGDRITVPGDATSNAVKNLWGQGLFDDVKTANEYNAACERVGAQNFLEDYFIKKVNTSINLNLSIMVMYQVARIALQKLHLWA